MRFNFLRNFLFCVSSSILETQSRKLFRKTNHSVKTQCKTLLSKSNHSVEAQWQWSIQRTSSARKSYHILETQNRSSQEVKSQRDYQTPWIYSCVKQLNGKIKLGQLNLILEYSNISIAPSLFYIHLVARGIVAR